MRNERDLYRDHLNLLIHTLMQKCTEATEDGFIVKTDKRSLELHGMARGVEMARDAYDMCKQSDKESAEEGNSEVFIQDCSDVLRQ